MDTNVKKYAIETGHIVSSLVMLIGLFGPKVVGMLSPATLGTVSDVVGYVTTIVGAVSMLFQSSPSVAMNQKVAAKMASLASGAAKAVAILLICTGLGAATVATAAVTTGCKNMTTQQVENSVFTDEQVGCMLLALGNGSIPQGVVENVAAAILKLCPTIAPALTTDVIAVINTFMAKGGKIIWKTAFFIMPANDNQVEYCLPAKRAA